MWHPYAIGAEANNQHQRTLIRETNILFWARTGYKVGRNLDMRDPRDRAMSKTWLQIFGEVGAFRKRATALAWLTYGQTGTPYILVTERRDGTMRHSEYPRRLNLDVQFAWITEQPDMFRYAAAFDFTVDHRTPIGDAFSTKHPAVG